MSTKLAKIIADFETSLAAKIAVGATTGTLQSNTDDDGVTIPTGVYYITIDRNNSEKEYYFCTITGVNITNIQSVSRQGAVTTGSAREHRVGANVIISDFAHIMRLVELMDGTTPLDGSTPLGYDITPTLSDGKQLATVAYVLSVVAGGTVNFSTQSYTGTGGETGGANKLVYFKESDQRWWLVDADLSATFDQVQLGISQSAFIAGGGITVSVLGLVSGFVGLTAGSKYYASNTAGEITTSSAQTTTVFVGVAISTTVLRFTPLAINMPTALEKAAISGLSTFTGAIVPSPRRSAPSGWLLCDGSAVSRTTYANLFAAIVPTGVFTVTIATPGVFTKVAHTLVEGDIVHFTTTGALPTGLAVNTDYYVIATGLTANTFQVSTTRSGSAVNTTGSQSGVHTFFATNDGKGDGSTTWNLPNLKGKSIFGYDVSDANFSSISVPKTYAGEKTHVLTEAELPAHTHTIEYYAGSGSPGLYGEPTGGAASPTSYTTSTRTRAASTGSNTAHNNLPPYSVANWLIKT